MKFLPLAVTLLPLMSPSVSSTITDPLYSSQQWYLDSANVPAAWAAGYTGAGVNIVFNDDGLDYRHPDFKDKYNQKGSTMDPIPGTCAGDHPDSHGTTCAGIAAAAANDNCGAGVAYNATVSAGNLFRDVVYASHNIELWQRGVCNNVNHVSSNSWGVDACMARDTLTAATCPFLPVSINKYSPCGEYSVLNDDFDGNRCLDDEWDSPSDACKEEIVVYCQWGNYHAAVGYTDPACADYLDLFVDCTANSMSNDDTTALLNAVTYGRNGKGVVFVFASGNEYTNGDDVNFEGWLNSQYTITVGAIAGDDKHSSYSSIGAPVLVSAPGGDVDQAVNMLQTLPIESGECAIGGPNSVGTSFATPVVSGVVALILEANPDLDWRDVQDVLVRSSKKIDADTESADWVTNGAALSHSYWYGFGKVDALAATTMAAAYDAEHTNVVQAVVTKTQGGDVTIPDADENGATSVITVTGEEAAKIRSVEHVNVYLTIDIQRRGDLEITLTGPSGIESLLVPATNDATDDMTNWRFMTVRHWGEFGTDLAGDWTLHVVDGQSGQTGKLDTWTLNLFGDAANGAKTTVKSDEECAENVADNLTWNDVVLGEACFADFKEAEFTYEDKEEVDGGDGGAGLGKLSAGVVGAAIATLVFNL